MKKLMVVLLAVMISCLATPACADDMAELKEQLIKQQQMIEQQNKMLQQMMLRIEQLESQQQQTAAVIGTKVNEAVEAKQVKSLPKNMKWVENVQISGDLRYRHESIDAETTRGGRHEWKNGRTRHRLRARLMVKAMINGDWDVVFRLASGSSDPVSTNQTLGDSFSTKDIRLDLAYFDWHPENIPSLKVLGGKMPMPMYKVGKNELIWDGDLNPEGIAAQYQMPLGDSGRNTLHINGGGFWAAEDSDEVDGDYSLWAAQGYLKHEFEDEADSYLLGGASIYAYGNLQGNTLIADETDGFGNTTFEITPDDPATPCCDEETLGYVGDYDLYEIFGEYGTKINGMPVSVFGSYVKNAVAATSMDTGWLIGFQLNKAKKPGSWQFKYNYRELEADAVLGAFTDSDFIGGGTDGKGHEFGFKYQFTK